MDINVWQMDIMLVVLLVMEANWHHLEGFLMVATVSLSVL